MATTRDLRIDWLRGLAMACVIVNHSKLTSLLSWFSYERLWTVTAAEVFVVLSGVVLGMVYGRRLARDGWKTVARGLGRRAVLLYASFIGVTVSILALAAMGVDVRAVAPSAGHANAWFFAPQTMDAGAWRDLFLMRAGPWAFEIVGMYVWLVAAAVPCLLLLRRAGWRSLLAASWILYLWYRVDPRPLTMASFESSFPLLAWQLLFAHGIALGYHRERISAAAERMPRWMMQAGALVAGLFTMFAFCNPWTDGPSWLHLPIVSPERFTSLYGRYFALRELGAGRLLNLAFGLPVAYAIVTRYWSLLRPLHVVLVTLGQRSLGAFVLHVYALLLLAYLPLPEGVLVNTLAQIALVVGIAAILHGLQRLRGRRRATLPPHVQPIAA